MTLGAHPPKEPEAAPAFPSDVPGFRSVDVGHRWLIFAMPPPPAAIHSTDTDFSRTHAGEKLLDAMLYLICGRLKAEIALLQGKNLQCPEITKRRGERGPSSRCRAHARLAGTSQDTRRR